MNVLNESHEKLCLLRYGVSVESAFCRCKELRQDAAAAKDPKLAQALKEGKTPMEYLVFSVLADDARCHKGGADEYGINNWLADKILASTYIGAMLRHLFSWAIGIDKDKKSGLSHLTHLRACCAVVLDAEVHGTLIDDRNRVESKDKENKDDH